MNTVYGVEDWSPKLSAGGQHLSLRPRIFQFRFYDVAVRESWIINTLQKEPVVPGFLDIPSVFFTDAKEIEAKPILKGLTFGYERATTWFLSGAQFLGLSGWRPDCTVAQTVNFARTSPPRNAAGCPFHH